MQPTNDDTQPTRQRKFTRRDILAGLGIGGLGAWVAGILGGFAGRAYLNRQASEPQIVIGPNEATPPTATFTPDLRPPIVSRAEWGALSPNHQAYNEFGFYPERRNGWRAYEGDLRDVYQTVIIHHSVEYDRTDRLTMLKIQQLHRVDRGWADIAYHYLIGKDGDIYAGRDIGVRGTHVGGYNTGSLGVCLLGNFMVQTPTQAQIRSAHRLLKWLAVELALTHIATHKSFNAETVCPGDNLTPYIEEFAQSSNLQIGTDGYESD